MKRINTLLFAVLIISTGSYGQSYSRTDLGIKLTVDTIGIEIQFFSPSIVRVLKWPEGKTFVKESLSVVKTPQKTTFLALSKREMT